MQLLPPLRVASIAIALTLPCSAYATDWFTSPSRIFHAPGYGFVTAADVNGDGKLDLATSAGFLPGMGDGIFGPFTSLGSGLGRPMAVADFNHDGCVDLVMKGTGSSQVPLAVRYGGPSGVLMTSTLRNVAVLAGVAVADVNGDGDADIMVADTHGLLALLAHAGGFPDTTLARTGSAPTGLAVGDFNHDGVPDAAVMNTPSQLNCYVSIHLGHGDGSFGTRTDIALSVTSGGILALDYDHDGNLDLIAGTQFLRGNGDGTFASPQTLANPFGGFAGDLDGDGRTDFVSGTTVYWQQPNGSFAATDVGAPGPVLGVGDFDGDGVADLVASDNSDFIKVRPGHHDRSFGIPGTATNDVDTERLGVTDFNHDGIPDVASMTNRGFASVLRVSIGRRDGTFQSAQIPLLAGNSVVSAAIGDVNGDGNPDLVVTAWNSQYCFHCPGSPASGSVYFGNGGVGFDGNAVYDALVPGNVYVADVNGDGIGDIVFTHTSTLSGYPLISVMLGPPPRTPVDTEVPDGTPGQPLQFANGLGLRDVNGDGRADFFGKTGVLLARSDGTFQDPIPYPSGFTPMAAGDLDGDGTIDVVGLVRLSHWTVAVGHGHGDGSFDPPSTFDSGISSTNITSIALHIADWDGDGHLDVLLDTATSEDATQEVASFLMLQSGSGLNSAIPLDVSGMPADMNGDHRLDLVTSGHTYFNLAALPTYAVPTGTRRDPQFALSRSSPNPGTGLITIEYAAGRDASVDLAVFDLAGRAVARLVHGPITAGVHRVKWNDGRPGVFWVDYRFPGGHDARRIVRLR